MTSAFRLFRPSAILAVAALFGALVLSSCGSSEVVKNLTADERFQAGKKLYDDGDYLEAINEFQLVKLQFPASSVADDAQYFLGECRFARGEYLLASEEFQSLKRLMASSPFVPQAQYKIAMCYYMLSPRSTLDQTYSRKAIEEFQTFIEDYRSDTLVAPAETKIKELNTRLAQKLFETAEVYEKLEYNKSATIYYDMVVEQYHDTEYAEPALLHKVRVLMARKKFDDAKGEIDKFLTRYPASKFRDEAETLKSSIDALSKPTSSSGGAGSGQNAAAVTR
jgi:outer membrane protein assembly factor BamD